MDNLEAREWLAAYRPEGRDALDPAFSLALAQAESDPDLKDWFADQRAFDSSAANALGSLPVPTEGKEQLLAELQPHHILSQKLVRFPWRIGAIALAAAACLAILVSIRSPQTNLAGTPIVRQDSFSLSQLANNINQLGLKSNDPAEIRSWLASHAAPQPSVLGGNLASSGMIGCKVYQTDNGGHISLICIRVNEELVHVFTFDRKSRSLLDVPSGTWWREGFWNMRAFPGEDQLVVLVTQLDPASLDISSSTGTPQDPKIIETRCPPKETPVPPGPFA